jgi:hypothetical protein
LLPTPFGDWLTSGPPVFLFQLPHVSNAVSFSTLIPPLSIGLLDLPLFVQGACSGAPGTRLSNAFDVLVGR